MVGGQQKRRYNAASDPQHTIASQGLSMLHCAYVPPAYPRCGLGAVRAPTLAVPPTIIKRCRQYSIPLGCGLCWSITTRSPVRPGNGGAWSGYHLSLYHPIRSSIPSAYPSGRATVGCVWLSSLSLSSSPSRISSAAGSSGAERAQARRTCASGGWAGRRGVKDASAGFSC